MKPLLRGLIGLGLLVPPLLIFFFTRNFELAAYLLAGEVIAVVLLSVALIRTVIVPLGKMRAHVQEMQRDNLDASLKVATGQADMIEKMAQSLADLQESLRESRKAQQEKLARTQEATRSAIDSLPHAIAVVSPEGKIELVNRVAESLFGLAPGSIAQGSAPPWLGHLVAEARRTMTPVKPEGYKSAVQIFDKGRELFFLPQAIPLLDADKKLVGITVMLEDATELRHIEEAKSNLLAMVSHELKTPLTSIQMSIHLLAEDLNGQFSARQRELLQAASEDADRLNSLIQRLLDKGGR